MDVFWIGFAIGYIICLIVSVVLELICIALDKNELKKWMQEVE